MTNYKRIIRFIVIVVLSLTTGIEMVSAAGKAYAQSTLLTLELSNKSIKDVLSEIEKNSEFVFFYYDGAIDVDRKIDIDVKDQPIDKILDNLFRATGNMYVINDRQVFISPVAAAKEKTTAASANQQQTRTITGVVRDAIGEVIGANVIVKGTTIGVVTDMDGRFSLPGVPPNAVLQISYVGYVTQEIRITNQTNLEITIVEDTEMLEELVVVGYGTVKRSDLVSSVSSVSLSDVKSAPTGRVDDLLQGRSTGLVIQNTSATPDATFNIRIRGSNSISGSNQPLVVVDGFLGGNMNTINPNDIESIEVLKDASATAIYGSRGANGVILIQTKKGKMQKPVIEVNSYLTFSTVAKKLDRLNAGQYAELVNEVRDVFNQDRVFTQPQIDEFYAKGGTDWQDEIFRTALQQNYQASVSGGSEKMSYYLSGNYLDNQGIVINSSMERVNIRSNITTDLTSKLKLGLNMSFNNTTNHPTTGGRDSNPVNGAEGWAPTLPVYNQDGTYTQPAPNYGPKSIYNPVANALEPIVDNKSVGLQLNSFLDYTIIKGLTARILLAYQLRDNENSRYSNTKPQGGVGNASASISNSRSTMLQNTYQINYNQTFGVHNLNLTLVGEQQIEESNSSAASSSDFLTDALTYNNLSLGAIPGVPSSSRSKRVIQSLVGRANYSLGDKYLFSFTGRYDGSSVFGENHKWGFFPSGAFAWRVNNEGFMKDIEQISNLKLRVSYGITGSQALEPYATLAQLRTDMRYSNEAGTDYQPGVGFRTIPNPDLRWEKTKQYDIGADLGLFNQRLLFSVDYYKKNTTDLLYSVPVPRASGYLSRIENIGEISNYGFEIQLEGDPFVGKFKWNTSLSLSLNRNEVVKLASGENEVGFDRVSNMDLLPGFGNTIFLIVGQPMGVIKGYQQRGTWGTAEAEEAARYGVIPGAPKYVDQNQDGAITVDDMVVIGSPLPKYSFGWTNSFSYKNFTLSLVIQGVQGIDVYNIARIRTESQVNNIGIDVTDTRILNKWTPNNQNTNVPSIEGSLHEKLQSDRWMEDGSYVRLKTVTLGYNLPKSILAPLGITSLRAYVSGQNLLTLTNFTGWDPEGRSSNGLTSDLFGGISIGTYPAQLGFTTGINLVF